MFKRFLICLILLMITALNVCALEGITAQSAVVIDSVTGKVLGGKNYNEKLGMASTTKIMTGILALEKGDMDDIVTISKNPPLTEGSSIYLAEGEKVSVETLVYGLLLKSGNDAAVALAEYISGSEKEFVKLMNEKAAELGLKNTKFDNPHGLYAEDHYTTAYELAQLARYAMQNEEFAKIVNTEKYRETPPEDREMHYINNANKLILMYEEADGIKPGYTPETGRTLVGSWTKEGWRVITVTLNCADDWNEHKKMADYAFKNYELKKIAGEGDSVGTIRIRGGVYNETGAILNEDVYIPVKKGTKSDYKLEMEEKKLEAPIQAGDKINEAKIVMENETITVDVVANTTVEKKGYNVFALMWDFVLALFG